MTIRLANETLELRPTRDGAFELTIQRPGTLIDVVFHDVVDEPHYELRIGTAVWTQDGPASLRTGCLVRATGAFEDQGVKGMSIVVQYEVTTA